jgi:hypothetical protein
VSRPGSGRRIDIRREVTFGGALPQAPFASRLINANYADREIVLAGSDVSAWGDVVGGRDFVQANTSKDPAYGVFTTKPALVFDGVNDFMQAPAVNYAPYPAITLAFVFTYTAAGLVAIKETSVTYSSNVGAFIIAGNGGTLTPSYFSGVVQSRAFACANGTHRLIVTLDTTQVGTITACYLDGVSVGATPAGASAALGNYVEYIGMRAGTSLPWAGKLGTDLVYSGTFTAGEVATIDAFLAASAV